MNLWHSILDAVRRWWRPAPPPPPAVQVEYTPPAPEPQPAPTPEPLPAPPPRQKVERYRAATLRRDVLDQLGNYEKWIRRLQKHDSDAYDLYKRLGAFVFDRVTQAPWGDVEPIFKRTLPSFGAVATGISSKDDYTKEEGTGEWLIPVRFAYFLRLERPDRDIEYSNSGTIYRCRFYVDTDKNDIQPYMAKRGHGLSMDFAVSIGDDGTVRALKRLRETEQVIRHKQGVLKGSKTVIHHQRWEYPEPPNEWFIRHKITPQHATEMCFAMVANWWVKGSQSSMIRVTATKNNIVMPFLVDVLKTPQFFSDREKVKTESGRTRPIFHIVRPHMRGNAAIKLHFAGLRRFSWNGYEVHITVPGKDHADIAEFPGGWRENASDEELLEPDSILPAELAERLADLIDAPGGAEEVNA